MEATAVDWFACCVGAFERSDLRYLIVPLPLATSRKLIIGDHSAGM